MIISADLCDPDGLLTVKKPRTVTRSRPAHVWEVYWIVSYRTHPAADGTTLHLYDYIRDVYTHSLNVQADVLLNRKGFELVTKHIQGDYA